jgi:2-C-methyl-D-erythritol 4-phosphate cytidylyltransferase
MDRTKLRALQTPQTFKTELLLPAYRQEYQEIFTDEATVVEAAGMQIHLTEGLKNNIKITTPEDLAWAEKILEL